MKKKALVITLTVVLATGLIVSGAYAYRNVFNKPEQKDELTENGNQNNGQLIGGQKDEHGCLPPAGYSWCEAKQKCLRTWEEACTADDALKNFLRDNLSTLSPEKEVLGGKFFVTELKVLSSTQAQVDYEDGHNAFRAKFDYSISGEKVTIKNFKIVTPSTPPAQKQENITLTFQPMQCETEPWQEWYGQGKIKFFKAPTDEELIKTYYGTEKNINIISASRIDSENATCEACNVCKKNYSFTAIVTAQDASRLQALGWKE